MDFDRYANPGPEYRAKPFWALNDELEEGEIRRQINIFKEMGFGGYFMHSRVGLKTEFLGGKWFDMISAGIDEGKKAGLETWLYDEDRWPSGIAGGYVTLDHRCRAKRLHCLRTKGDSVPPDSIAAFRYELRGGGLASYRKVNAGEFDRDEDALAFVVRTGFPNDDNIGFFNGATYIDTLSRQTVARFIDEAYKPYLRFKGEFGSGVMGIFTDEPNRGCFLGTPYGTEWERQGSQYQTSWTGDFADEFKKRKGYDILERLPEVFFNLAGETCSRVRYDAADVTAQLFTEAYVWQIAGWCRENGLTLTGHYLGEDNLYMLNWGAGVADRFYEPMDVPGIDLINQIVEYMVPKQVQGAARQFGKKWTMCEMYAHSGWGYSLQQYKSYGEWNTVFGINLRCPHLSLYSMAGQRKRDCPPNISFQQAWHRDYRIVEDHFARLGAAVTDGSPLCSLLVVHPIDSTPGVLLPGWAERKPDSGFDELASLEREFKKFTRSLMGLQIDFDASEEFMIQKHGRIETVNGETVLMVGRMAYSCVAVPPLASMRKGVADLLTDFTKAGGRVVFINGPVGMVDFMPDGRFGGYPAVLNETEAVERKFGRYGTIQAIGGNRNDILAAHKRCDNCDTLLLVNTSLDKTFEGEIHIQSEGWPQFFDTLTCERLAVPAESEGGWLKFPLGMPKGGSALIFITDEQESLPVYKPIQYKTETRIEGPYDIYLDSPNVLLLDRPEYSFAGGPPKTAHILEADGEIRDSAGFERRSNSMYQPWFKRKFFGSNEKCLDVELTYAFTVSHIPSGELYLCLEQPERHSISVNGTALPQTDCGWFSDKCIRKLELNAGMLKLGKNIIKSVCRFDEEADLEAMYITGDFGVSLNGFEISMGPPVTRLDAGDIAAQGLPFYAGSVGYRMAIGEKDQEKPIRVRADGFRGIALRIIEPGCEPRLLPFEPYEADVNADAFIIELICSMGNAMGMERHAETGYPLTPQGLMVCPRVVSAAE